VARFETHARGLSLTLPQCKVLVRLEKNEGVSQARLAELAEVEPMTMGRLLDRMESDGLLERRPDPAARRARCPYRAPKAQTVLEEIWRLAELTRSEIFAGVSRSERHAFMQVLERMHHNLNELESREAEHAKGQALKSRLQMASVDHD